MPDARLATPVRAVRRAAGGQRRGRRDGGHRPRQERFDEVVLATHTDQALALLRRRLGRGAARAGRGALPAQPRRAAHRRLACCPTRRWPGRPGTTSAPAATAAEQAGVCLHYLLNQLQPLPFEARR
jgi:predicted NAD/FAD-binding protein